MEASIIAQGLRFSGADSEKMTKSFRSSVPLAGRWRKQSLQRMITGHLQRKTSTWSRLAHLEVSRSFKNYSDLGPRSVTSSFEHSTILKNKSQGIAPCLNGRSIYLVGMMGCGKTTVGKILSAALGYSFVDSDAVVEYATGKTSVTEIFKLCGEAFFRDKESEALWQLSLRRRLVVSTGGGAVVRSVNWEYMHEGISVWLDVPLKALAQRLAAVGTDSRPLLDDKSGDPLEKTYGRLSTLWEERCEAYANANARISFESIADKLGQRDVSNLSPTVIAIEVLEQIGVYLREDGMET